MAMECCASQNEVESNFYATLDRGYLSFNEYIHKHSGKVCLVGSGPSLAATKEKLSGDICAINSAIGYLLDHDIVPKWAMLWDASPLIEKFAVPHPDVTYLVASRCHPKVFERLKDCKVVVWHAGGDYDIIKIMNKPEVIAKQKYEEPLVNGGSAGITRGLFLVTALGYNEVHVFGADASYGLADATHVRGSLVPEKDFLAAIGDSPPIWFRTTPEWVAQVDEYKAIFSLMLQNNVKIEVHGTGMLPTMHEILVAKLAHCGMEQFIKDMETQEKERMALDKMASDVVAKMTGNATVIPQPLEGVANVANASH